MSGTNPPKPATRSSKRSKRPSSPVLEFLSNARKKRGGSKEATKDATVKPTKSPPPPVTTISAVEESAPGGESVVAVTAPVGAPVTTLTDVTQSVALTAATPVPITASLVVPPPVITATVTKEQPLTKFIFKNPHFVHQSRSHSSKKSKSWKSLKQILATQRNLYNQDHVKYATIDAPSSFKPAKKYSDLSGFEAKYTDPKTKMRYSNTQEFAQVRILPSETVTGLLSLRRANQEVP